MSKLNLQRSKISVVIKRGSVKSACLVLTSAPPLISTVFLAHLLNLTEPHCLPL